MSRTKGKRGGGGFRGRRRDNRGGGGGGGFRAYQSYPDVPKSNARLEMYYNTLLQLPEEEKQEFWEALKRELPNSFRFCGSKGHALAVKRLLQTRYIPEITKITQQDGRSVAAPEPVPWYPDNLAWWMTTPKNVIRKFPPFAAFQKFLVSETSVGNISRQEVVSMIPPLLIDLRPGMTVLDLCAAPGSKAAQLLEMVHRGEEARMRKVMQPQGEGAAEEEGEAAKLDADPSDDGRATGMLIANDMDYKRSHMLIHQLKRLSSPNMIVTHHDATMFPSIRVPSPEDPAKNHYLRFDRILADVPCSGDGTLRKNVNMWKDWSPGNALGLHATQVRILVRALQMLKVGGRVVYSTCSMNPVENEAVVAAAIERCRGPDAVEIVDCGDKLPQLKRRPGLTQWKIMDKAGKMWSSWDEVDQHVRSTEDGTAPSRLADTMFPPAADSACAALPLDRCMRVYGHLQDTGGFFITVLEKKVEFKAAPERTANSNNSNNGSTNGSVKRPRDEETAEAEDDAKRQKISEAEAAAAAAAAAATAAPSQIEENGGQVKAEEPEETKASEIEQPPVSTTEAPAPKPALADAGTPPTERKRKPDGPYEEPFKYLAEDNEVIQDVSRFYNISARFPRNRFMVRNGKGEPAKAIYYTSQLVRDILVLNEGRGVRFIHGGVKMFVKQDSPSAEVCRWRIQSEGMPILHAYVGEERVVVLRNKETFRRLLVEMFPKIADGLWADLGEIGERVRDVGMGCCVLRVEPDTGADAADPDPDFAERLALPLWKSFQSLNLMLPKEDRSAMLLRIFNDTTPLINTTLKKQQQQKEKEEHDATATAAAGDGGAPGKGEPEANAEPGVKKEEEVLPDLDTEPVAKKEEDEDLLDLDPQVVEDAMSEEE